LAIRLVRLVATIFSIVVFFYDGIVVLDVFGVYVMVTLSAHV